jgi:hypothetical protein
MEMADAPENHVSLNNRAPKPLVGSKRKCRSKSAAGGSSSTFTATAHAQTCTPTAANPVGSGFREGQG